MPPNPLEGKTEGLDCTNEDKVDSLGAIPRGAWPVSNASMQLGEARRGCSYWRPFAKELAVAVEFGVSVSGPPPPVRVREASGRRARSLELYSGRVESLRATRT